MTPKMITSTALSLIVAMGATQAAAQDASSSGTSDQEIMEKIEAADAPDTAETDPVNETASPGTQMAQSNSGMQGGTVLDLQSLSHDIYERGYRQGYIRGVQEAREDFAMQLSYMARREQLMENYEDWRTNQSDGSGSAQTQDNTMNNNQGSNGGNGADQAQADDGNPAQDSSVGSARQTQQSASNSGAATADNGLNRRSNMMGARPGGTIVILPEGVTPEQFIESLVDSRGNARMTNGDQSDS